MVLGPLFATIAVLFHLLTIDEYVHTLKTASILIILRFYKTKNIPFAISFTQPLTVTHSLTPSPKSICRDVNVNVNVYALSTMIPVYV